MESESRMTRRARIIAETNSAKVATKVDAIESLRSLDKAVKVKTRNSSQDRTVSLTLRVETSGKGNEAAVRGSVRLPKGSGKVTRVVAFVPDSAKETAIAAGAIAAGGAELAERIKSGWTEFDVVVASPDRMGVVGPLGRVLGPRGLMPSPKAGTVSSDVVDVIKQFVGGRVEFRADDAGNVHVVIGKLSFDTPDLLENMTAALASVVAAKPAQIKGQFVKRALVTATMLPSVVLTDAGV